MNWLIYGAAAMTIAVGIKQLAPSIGARIRKHIAWIRKHIAWIREHYNHQQH